MKTAKAKTRNNNIDIIKGIAIILMVYGHTFGMAKDYIYLFHMPIFIFISGYCFNNFHGWDVPQAEHYFFSRIKRLIVPYMGYNIVFTLLTNFFIRINFYSDKEEFKMAVVPIQKAAQGLHEHLEAKDMIMELYRVITLNSIPQMGSAGWFLIVLFYVCIIHCLLIFVLHRIENKYLKWAAWIAVFVIMAIMTGMISDGLGMDAGIPMRHLEIFEVYTCFLIGAAVARYDLLKKLPGTVPVRAGLAVAAAVILLFLLRFGTLEMSKCFIVNTFFLIAVTLLGYVLLDSVAELLKQTALGKALIKVGNHTIPILFLHILSFKFVSLFYLLITGQPLYLMASWPVIFQVPEWMCLIYTVVGVALPLAGVRLYQFCKEQFRM